MKNKIKKRKNVLKKIAFEPTPGFETRLPQTIIPSTEPETTLVQPTVSPAPITTTEIPQAEIEVVEPATQLPITPTVVEPSMQTALPTFEGQPSIKDRKTTDQKPEETDFDLESVFREAVNILCEELKPIIESQLDREIDAVINSAQLEPDSELGDLKQQAAAVKSSVN